MPLRRAVPEDLRLLETLRNAAQEHLQARGSLQVLSNVDETAMSEYWLFSSAAPVVSADNAIISGGSLNSCSSSTETSATPLGSGHSHLGLFLSGSCRVSTCVPSHIRPHLPHVSSGSNNIRSGTCKLYTYLYVSSIIIHPLLQQKGLGRQMVQELQELSASHSEPGILFGRLYGLDSIDHSVCLALDVWAGNTRLREWYSDLGWRHVATVEEVDDSTEPRLLQIVAHLYFAMCYDDADVTYSANARINFQSCQDINSVHLDPLDPHTLTFQLDRSINMQTAANTVQDHMGPVDVPVEPGYKHREDGSKMKALAWFGANDVRVIEAPVPDITEPNDVVVKVTGTTICGSDLHLFHGEIMTLQKGDILGHEFMGVVDRVGPNVTNLKPGQRVVASFQIACGECGYCKQKLSSFCDRTNNSSLQNAMYGTRDAGFFGYSHFTGGFPGGQAEYVKVPYGNVNLLPIPDNVTDEQGIYLSDVIPTSYHCVVDTGVKEGDVVAIWGLGPIGQCAARWAQIKGAKRVIGIDSIPERLAFAAEKSGIETLNFKEHSDVAARLLEIVPGGVDVALDCGTFHEPKTLLHKVQKTLMLETDVSETANEMIKSVRKMGRCGVIAAYAGYTNNFAIGALMEKGVRFIGNGQAPVHLYWQEILNDYIIPGKFDPTFMITHRVPIDDMAKLYTAFDKRINGVEKVFVETRFSNPPSSGCPTTSRVDEWSK
ncbi:alcohol dehydrogenase [Ceratobasidium sp. AG-Ba]|nr:alcohol dehydrogenase [Ceratobasidium sp. AG-Ba]